MYKHLINIMKKLILTLLVSTVSYFGFSQSCCSPTKSALKKDDMQLMASTKEFQKAHAEPLPYTHVSLAGGEMIQFKTPDGQTANAFLIKATTKSNKYLFVYQEWWGLNDHIKKQAEIFYNDLKDVNVIAIDMYDGKIATTSEDAGKYMSGADPKRLQSIIQGAVAYVGPKAKIASVGWCFGGGLSLKSALLEGKQAVGCVMYYGMPEKDVEKLKTLHCDVLGLFAAKEQWISPTVVAQFEKDMSAAGKTVKVKNYDAEHAFANPSNPKFDKVASEDAYSLAITYLKSKF
jgi:carboxymethylenebutenolidase